MENDSLPQYMQIALSIAGRIAGGDVPEGAKISGRSSNPRIQRSPETIQEGRALSVCALAGQCREKNPAYTTCFLRTCPKTLSAQCREG